MNKLFTEIQRWSDVSTTYVVRCRQKCITIIAIWNECNILLNTIKENTLCVSFN